MPRDHHSTVAATLKALDRHLDALGPAGMLEATATIDLPDHLWLAIRMMCLDEDQRDSIVQALLRFSPLDVMEFADGSVRLSNGSRGRLATDVTVKAEAKPEPGIEAYRRPPFRAPPARRKALRLGR